MVMSVLWAQKSTGMKGKYSLTATINPYRRKKGGVRNKEWSKDGECDERRE